jgi:RIO kinase 1
VPGGSGCLLAAKRYRGSEHRMFHRDAGYQEGRRTRKSRDTRAMARRTEYGRDLLAGKWAYAEFEALTRLWRLDAPVPYPVQVSGTELMLEFIGDDDGTAAPRLAQRRPTPTELTDLFAQCVEAMRLLARAGFAHGDLSAYNLLVHQGRLVVIDVPQIVDVFANPQGATFLERDCANICRWFAGRGLETPEYEHLFGDLMAEAVARW